jgi:hypothetical protein
VAHADTRGSWAVCRHAAQKDFSLALIPWPQYVNCFYLFLEVIAERLATLSKCCQKRHLLKLTIQIWLQRFNLVPRLLPLHKRKEPGNEVDMTSTYFHYHYLSLAKLVCIWLVNRIYIKRIWLAPWPLNGSGSDRQIWTSLEWFWVQYTLAESTSLWQ